MNFGNGDTEFPVPNSTARVHGMLEVKRKKKFDKLIIAEIGEKNNCNNCGNGIAENREKIFFCENLIMAMPLPK